MRVKEVLHSIIKGNPVGDVRNTELEQNIMGDSTYKLSVFWNYFQRWKQYFPMEQQEREQYLEWIEEIVYSRADAIVGGHYGEVAVLLAMIGDVKEQMGKVGEKRDIFAMYKKKFPRHSSFQAEMKRYFEM